MLQNPIAPRSQSITMERSLQREVSTSIQGRQSKERTIGEGKTIGTETVGAKGDLVDANAKGTEVEHSSTRGATTVDNTQPRFSLGKYKIRLLHNVSKC